MLPILLIHWKAEEAPERLARLRAAGYQAEHRIPTNLADLKRLGDPPPAAFVIDLDRIPSHGREIGLYLRRQKSTRLTPLVFVGGVAEKLVKLRAAMPDAVYTTWDEIAPALGQALSAPLAKPVVPDGMAGYSGTPLPKKLGLRDGVPVALVGAPEGFADTLGAATARGSAHRVLLFARSLAELRRRFEGATRRVEDGGGLWIVWPKKTSGVASDLGEREVREFGLAAGWVDYKICAVDQTWSGLLFARRALAPGRRAPHNR
jgi:hypothetical protein